MWRNSLFPIYSSEFLPGSQTKRLFWNLKQSCCVLSSWQVLSKQQGQRANALEICDFGIISKVNLLPPWDAVAPQLSVNSVKSPGQRVFQNQNLWLGKEKGKPLRPRGRCAPCCCPTERNELPGASKLLPLLTILTKDTSNFPHCTGQVWRPTWEGVLQRGFPWFHGLWSWVNLGFLSDIHLLI